MGRVRLDGSAAKGKSEVGRGITHGRVRVGLWAAKWKRKTGYWRVGK